MKRFRKASLVALISVSLLPASYAMAQSSMGGQGTVGPQAGDNEFTLSGTGSSDKDFDNSSFGASVDYGWYLSRSTLVGVRQSVNFADVEGEGISDDFWNGSTRGFADYHFGLGAARPFVGASLGAIYGDGVKDTGVAGLETGLKYYVLPTTFIQARAEYQFLFEDSDSAEDNFDDGVWAYTFGMGVNF
ncbi:hypothetical protein [Halomonas koreensis]|uniref:Outer membrane protein beta-barrel domain-containing protein n=1 Tax=Halomonas koreensis TaxID=245385 RepID=A0ABU1FZX1_9GAMM|nr:hypothetical protein [Halomonas koreensis]MDR5866211.1 hypothetical protein [Halomonas koreensis]